MASTENTVDAVKVLAESNCRERGDQVPPADALNCRAVCCRVFLRLVLDLCNAESPPDVLSCVSIVFHISCLCCPYWTWPVRSYADNGQMKAKWIWLLAIEPIAWDRVVELLHEYVMICLDHKITKDKTKNDSNRSNICTSISAVSLHQGLVCRNTCLAMHHQKLNEMHWQQTHLFCAVSVLEGVHRMIWGASSLRQWVRGYGNPGWHWGKWQWCVSV